MKQVKTESSYSLIAGLLLFLWLGLIVGGYFWGHTPFGLSIAVALGTRLLDIGGWLLISWLGWGLGRVCLRPFSLPASQVPSLTRLILEAGTGLGLISILMALLGLLGLFQVWVAWLLVLLLAGATFRQWKPMLADIRQIGWPRPNGRLHRFILFYAVACLLLTFLMSLAPIIAWDSHTYHLLGPRFYIEAGRFVHPVNIPHLGFPMLGQMQFTLAMLLVGDGVTPLLHFGYGLLTLLLVIQMTQEQFGRDAGWLAAAVWLTAPTTFSLMSWPYVDITLMFYATAAFYTFLQWRKSRQNSWLLLMGIFCGFCGGVKYTAVAIPIALSLSIWWSGRQDGLVATIRRLTLVAVPALLLVLPWLIRNLITTGNPVYPFFFADAKFWDAWWRWWYDLPGTGLATTAPWRLLTAGLEATIAGTEGTSFYDATIGPFLLSLLVLLPFVWRRFEPEQRQVLGHMLLFFGVNYALWLNGLARSALLFQARLLFFVFGITAVLGGAALAKTFSLKHPALDIGWLTRSIFSLTFVVLLLNYALTVISHNPLRTLVGLEEKEAYLTRQLGDYYLMMQEGINSLPPEASVVMLWETRSYLCEVMCHPDPILGRFLHLTQHKQHRAADIRAEWEGEGITHVLLSDQGLNFLLKLAEEEGTGTTGDAMSQTIREEDIAILNALQDNELQLVQRWGESYSLYEWR